MSTPLCVDLDGTLLLTDTVHEQLLLLLKRQPWMLFLLPFWFFRGREYLKRQLDARVDLPIDSLPFNLPLLTWLKEQKERGKELILVTGSYITIAQKIAVHLQCFDDVMATTENYNMRGEKKRDALLLRFGEKKFDYIGNDASDVPVWKAARQSIICQKGPKKPGFLRSLPDISVIETDAFSWKVFLKTIRVHQYAKNILLFLPMLLAHQLTNTVTWTHTCVGFVSFCLLASSVYVFNDLLDLDVDRRHPRKSKRGFASGQLSISMGIALFLGLLFVSTVLASTLPAAFTWVLAAYYVLTLLYSFRLKQVMLVDVLALSMLYTLRLFAGAAILAKPYSHWLILFSLSFFTGLAFLKRYVELKDTMQRGNSVLNGRGYIGEDISMLHQFGVCAGYLSVLILALYLSSQKAAMLYAHPNFLYAMCPLLIYWVSRIWMLANRDQVHDDPIVFALKDKTTYLIAGLVFVVGLFAAF
ncbi:MAG: membrane protein [marine bacterium B5-7]|nr:MAG: membrane protein [marine bacterium B5-7]